VSPARDALGHLADDGTPCTLHGPASAGAIATLAAIGSRVSAFNHEIASKLQSLMMSLDELSDLLEAQGDPALRRTVEAAHATLRELGALLTANRTLTRATAGTTVPLRDLVRGAGERVGIAVRGELPDGTLEGVSPLLAVAIGLALDAVAGSGRNRAVELTATPAGATIVLGVPMCDPAPANASDALAIAAHVIAAAGGELRCGHDRVLRVTLPFAGHAR